jgi:hypothetical protein
MTFLKKTSLVEKIIRNAAASFSKRDGFAEMNAIRYSTN